MTKKQIIILTIIFALVTILMRVIPHPWNFTPMGALVLFSGFYLPRKWMWLSLVALSITDLIIGTYQLQVMMVVYGSYAVMLGGAYALRGTRTVRMYKAPVVLGASLASAVLFFITTNFAHWMWFGGYAHNLSGLMSAYIAAIPFFKNSLMGYVVYSGVFFGVYEFVRYSAKLKFHQKKITSSTLL